jgi:hypothetical protein
MKRGWTPDARIIDIDYDVDAVNRSLLGGSSHITDIAVSRALYKYYLYDLVMMQVTNELQKLRDPTTSARLVEAFSASAPTPVILKGINDIAPRGSADFELLVGLIAQAKKEKKTVGALLSTVRFSWDKKYMKTFMSSDKIKTFISDSCVRGQVSIKSFPNVYEPCSGNSKQDYCESKGRLIVDCDDAFWDALPKLIVDDLTNNIKGEYIMDRLYYDNIIDEYSYNVSPMEDLFIKKK